jgi:FlaG/FlaF family flagellin (archaellin)
MNLSKVPKRRGIDPIIATLLLIAISVAAGIIVYVFVTGLSGSLTGTGGQQVTEQVSMDAYIYSPISSGVAVYVRNVGTATTTLDSGAMFFDGLTATDTHTGFAGTSCFALATSYQMSVGTVCYFSFTTTPLNNAANAATAGTSHAIKVISKTGGTFVFSVIAGRSG